MDDDADTICPQCNLPCPISLNVHNEQYHVTHQPVCFKDGHAMTLQRDDLAKVFRCPRCSHPELRSRDIAVRLTLPPIPI
jgi:anaerobic selenocysteine-containing dehydrogenase